MRWDVGIDLGTDYVRMAEYREGAMLEEAARMAFREGGDMPICCGDAAATPTACSAGYSSAWISSAAGSASAQ